MGGDGAARGVSGLGGPNGAQAVARLEEMLGDDLDVREHRHEVRVPRPARHDVLVLALLCLLIAYEDTRFAETRERVRHELAHGHDDAAVAEAARMAE